MKHPHCPRDNYDPVDEVCANYGVSCDEQPETSDRLGSFLTQYDEYLDGSRSYDDLPTASGAHPIEQSVPVELTEQQRKKLRAGMLALKERLDAQRRYAAMGPTASAVNTTVDLVRSNASATIRDLVFSGGITAVQAAWLYEVRRQLAWRRLPWWDRLITRLLGGGP